MCRHCVESGYLNQEQTLKRGLGIPTIRDRATQMLAKLVLEPEWEALFEPNSYGFRPGRNCHDAIDAIFKQISMSAEKWVLDADFAKCFDNISHAQLLKKCRQFPTLQRQLKAWLKAGVMDGLEFSETPTGTPQGGVIAPPTIWQNFWLWVRNT